jgi:cell division protein ZapD
VIIYEYPLIERIRTLLRLEDLFERSRHFLSTEGAPEHHVALLTLFEILDVAGRADLKSELMQELERQKQVVQGFRDNPDVDQAVLSEVVQEIEGAYAGLYAMTGKIGQYLRENDWLMSIRQRSNIPGGVCEFDLPSYHYWLHRPSEERLHDLHAWTAPLHALRDGAEIVLRLLRQSGKSLRVTARGGHFQQMLSGRAAQMVRIRVPRDQDCVPEISANKYALNIRLTTTGEDGRPRNCEQDIEFDLTFCSL